MSLRILIVFIPFVYQLFYTKNYILELSRTSCDAFVNLFDLVIKATIE